MLQINSSVNASETPREATAAGVLGTDARSRLTRSYTVHVYSL